MIADLDAVKRENEQEEETQTTLLKEIGGLNADLREKHEEIAQARATLGAINTHNLALRQQNEDNERRLSSEMSLKLKHGQDMSRLREMLTSRDMDVRN